MNITVYLGANPGNDPALQQHMIDMGLSTPERQQGICFAQNLSEIRAILGQD